METKTKSKLKVIFLMIFILSSTIAVWAQSKNKIKQSYLINKNWVLNLEGKSYQSMLKFTDKEIIHILEFNSETAEIINIYYLSNKIDEEFDPKRMGKSKEGKYIIEQRNIRTLNVNSNSKITDESTNTLKTRSASTNINVFEIISVSDNKLVIKNLRNNSTIEYIAQ